MKEIMLSGKLGGKTQVDDEDYDMLNKYTWHAKQSHNVLYVVRKPWKSPTILMHRVILNTPDDMEIDHIDGNGLNNQKKNLRNVNHRENAQNRHQVRKKTSRFTGVDWYKDRGKWRAQIRLGGNSVHLGLFKIEEDARMAYVSAVTNLRLIGRK